MDLIEGRLATFELLDERLKAWDDAELRKLRVHVRREWGDALVSVGRLREAACAFDGVVDLGEAALAVLADDDRAGPAAPYGRASRLLTSIRRAVIVKELARSESAASSKDDGEG